MFWRHMTWYLKHLKQLMSSYLWICYGNNALIWSLLLCVGLFSVWPFIFHVHLLTCVSCTHSRNRRTAIVLCEYIEGWEPEGRKWHFTNFTGQPKQKFDHIWSDFVYWFQLFIIKMCTLMDDSTFASRKSSLRALIWYIYIYIYIYISISPKM